MQVPASMIQDTVAAVFSDRAYHRTTLLGRFWSWLMELLASIFGDLRPGGVPRPVFWTIVILLGAALLSLLARYVYLGVRWRAARLRRGGDPAFGGGSEGDAWAAARQHAARGDYTAAAHALYSGLLRSVAGRGELVLHESKTIGDYSRDLAAHSSPRVPRFREFARSYETVIYGVGYCDRDRYERLSGLAQRIMEPGG